MKNNTAIQTKDTEIINLLEKINKHIVNKKKIGETSLELEVSIDMSKCVLTTDANGKLCGINITGAFVVINIDKNNYFNPHYFTEAVSIGCDELYVVIEQIKEKGFDINATKTRRGLSDADRLTISWL